jgi:predicted lipoprotein with Yx(FWY)xxD motif
MRDNAIRWMLLVVLVAAAGTGGAMMALAAGAKSSMGTVDVAKSGALGSVLVAANGHTLYRFTVDSKGVNRCTSNPTCKAYWPALTLKAGTKPTAGSGVSSKLLATMAASHGLAQVTYAGYPLYYFSGDKKAGQTNGQGFQHKWYVVSTTGALVKHAATSTTPSPATTTTSSSGTSTSAWG